ncbi:MAG: glycosyltransferase [Pseudomonadota bacterium]
MPRKEPRVLMYCQALLGIGHLVRFLNIARALPGEVLLVYGGEPVPGLTVPSNARVWQQEPVRSDLSFQRIYSVTDPARSLPELQETRRVCLEEAFVTFQPDAFLLDTFPFSRNRFAPELTPLLKRIRKGLTKPCVVVTSVRDTLITRPDQDRYEDRVVEKLRKYVDCVLIHSDPTWQRFNDTDTFHRTVPVPHHYTGFVATSCLTNANSERPADDCLRIVVQIGGGRVGKEIIRTTASAVSRIRKPAQIRAFQGAFPSEDGNDSTQIGGSLQIEPFGPAYYQTLASADLLISQCGYNSMVDVLATGIEWITIPFGVNDEQPRRALRLMEHGVARAVLPAFPSPDELAAGINDLLVAPKSEGRRKFPFDLNGAHRSATLLSQLACRELPETVG